MSANVYVEIVEKVGDPSIETKEDLAEKATACLMDLGSASKYVVKNSHFHDNMERTIKDFVAHETSIDATAKMLGNMQYVMRDLHGQADRLQKCFAELPNVQGAIDATRSVARVRNDHHSMTFSSPRAK